ENVAGGGFRDHQGVAGCARHDVEKGQHMVVFIDLVAGKFAAQDLGEDVVGVVGGHGGSSKSAANFTTQSDASRCLVPVFPEWGGLGQFARGLGDIGALAFEIVRDRPT